MILFSFQVQNLFFPPSALDMSKVWVDKYVCVQVQVI